MTPTLRRPVCRECKLLRTLDALSLCTECTGDPDIRARHPVVQPEPTQTIRKGKWGPSRNDQIMLAALELTDLDQPLTVETLTYRCWLRWPKQFGARGMEERFFDTHYIRYTIPASRGPERRGWLSRIKPGLWVLTEPGRARALWVRGRMENSR